MRRKSLPFLCCLGLLAAGVPAQSDEVIQDALITQTSSDYIYWNAEDFDRLEFPAGNPTWRVNFTPPSQSVSGKTLRAQPGGNSNAGNNDSFAIYNFDFTSPGDYTFYAYRLGGEGDSMFPPPDFGAVPFHDPTFGNSVNRWNGIDNNAWNELGDDGCCDSPGVEYYASGTRGTYTVAAAGMRQFTIEARENNAQYDRFVLHTSKGLSGAELDALTFSNAVVNNRAAPPPPPPVISFEYTQTDKGTGSGTLSGVIDGITFNGAMPNATVVQNDTSGLDVPNGMIGYMDGVSSDQPGNPFGVYLGFGGQVVTLQGERDGIPYELDVPLVLSADGTPEADWRYETVLTDDGGNGNDAFGTGFRIAGWIGDPTAGHRHSASAFGDFLENAVDTVTVVGTHGDVGDNGRGDALGIAISLRNGSFAAGSGPIYVDNLIWQGGITVDPATIRIVPELSGLILICLSAGFAVIRRRRSSRR